MKARVIVPYEIYDRDCKALVPHGEYVAFQKRYGITLTRLYPHKYVIVTRAEHQPAEETREVFFRTLLTSELVIVILS